MKDGVLLTKPMCEGDSDENGQHIIDRVEQDIYLPSAATALGKPMLRWSIFSSISSRTSNPWPQNDVMSLHKVMSIT